MGKKTKSTIGALFAATLAVLAAASAHAEDIDIYAGSTGGGAPNVMIILDNASAWNASISFPCPTANVVGANNVNTAVGFEQCALYQAMDAIVNTPGLKDNINIGLMMFGSNQNGGGVGGTITFPNSNPTDLPLMNDAGIAAFQAYIKSIDRQADNSNNSQVGGGMQEAYAFFTGKTGLSGRTYSNHLKNACQKNFIIYIANANNFGKPQDTGQEPINALVAAGATANQQKQINTSPLGVYTKYDANWGDEWARFLAQTDLSSTLDDEQNIRTYTIAVSDGSNPDYVQFTKSMAGTWGKSFVVNLGDVSALVDAIVRILNEVLAVDSVFASSSLPVSVNAQGTYLNQVFIGMFRPDASGAPRWWGNLKQYQFGIDLSNPADPQLFLADSKGAQAISAAGSGFISPNAVSFWTNKDTSKLPDSIDGFWRNVPRGVGQGFDYQDGEFVEKGGVGQQLRLENLLDDYASSPSTPRRLYTCNGGSGICATSASLSATPFATTNSNITAASLGVNGPPMAISSITRNATTATVTLASAPNPALTTGQSVSIAGSQYAGYNGSFVITPASSTTFTFPVTVTPPAPAAGSYTATVPSNPQAIAALSRSGTTVTATANNHGYVVNQAVTITGANGAAYNGTFNVTTVTQNTFTYTITGEGPTTPAGSGTATVGSKTLTIATAANTGISRYTTGLGYGNGNNAIAAPPAGQAIVTVTTTADVTFSAGNSVTIAGASDSAYNGTYTIVTNGLGTNCPNGQKQGSKDRSFCFYKATTPVSPDASTSMQVDSTTVPVTITGLTHGASTCASNAQVTVAATTGSAPAFVTGAKVSVAALTPGTNESAYVGTFNVASVAASSPYGFTYTINADPGCSDTTAGMTASLSGVDRDTMIRWVRGEDNFGDEPSPSPGSITIRPSVHGDVLHSRPAVINYGGSIGVVVFYGSNDGVYRAINGNQTAAIGSIKAGEELWGFIPVDFYSKLARQRLNDPILKLANTSSSLVSKPKDYFFDGTTGVYQSGSTVHIYLSARRGGRVIYALDVSTPTDPKFMWRRTSGDAGFDELGYTFSAPKPARVKGYPNPVLIFGAGNHVGYDTNGDPVGEEADPPQTDTMGRGIFILDASTGCIVWQAGPSPAGGGLCTGGAVTTVSGMTWSIPSDIALLNRDFDTNGYIDRLYAADAGGNVWRVDLEPTAGNTPSNWQVTKFASLGGPVGSVVRRKILNPPDVVATKNFDIVLVATGDREHPLYSTASDSAYTVVNRFYGLKDTNVGMDASGWTTIVDDSSSQADAAPSGSVLFDATSLKYDGSLRGYYVTMAHPGEKIVNGPLTVGGFTYFGTNTPSTPTALTCSNSLGTARGYQVAFLTGQTAVVKFDGGGLPPTPVAGLVEIDTGGGNTRTVPFLLGGGNPSPSCVGPDCTSSIGGGKPPIPVPPIRKRLYWYIEKHDT